MNIIYGNIVTYCIQRSSSKNQFLHKAKNGTPYVLELRQFFCEGKNSSDKRVTNISSSTLPANFLSELRNELVSIKESALSIQKWQDSAQKELETLQLQQKESQYKLLIDRRKRNRKVWGVIGMMLFTNIGLIFIGYKYDTANPNKWGPHLPYLRQN